MEKNSSKRQIHILAKMFKVFSNKSPFELYFIWQVMKQHFFELINKSLFPAAIW